MRELAVLVFVAASRPLGLGFHGSNLVHLEQPGAPRAGAVWSAWSDAAPKLQREISGLHGPNARRFGGAQNRGDQFVADG